MNFQRSRQWIVEVFASFQTRRIKKIYLFGLIAIVGVNIGFYYGVIRPQKAKADILLTEIEKKRLKARVSESLYGSSDLKADIGKFYAVLPEKTQMTRIIRELDALAKETSLSIRDISYDSKKKGEEGIVPFSISFPVEGKYAHIKNFIYRLESSRRLVTIDSLNLEKSSGKDDIRLNIRMSVYLKN